MYDEDKYCVGCGQRQANDSEPQYVEQEDGYIDEENEEMLDVNPKDSIKVNHYIPDGARCKYCLGPISQETGECVLCHRLYFDEVESKSEEETTEESTKDEKELESNTQTEPRCRYCNGKISEETGRCLLCNRPYAENESETAASQEQKKASSGLRPSPRPAANSTSKPSAKAIDASFESIRNSNTRYKEDLEKYGTSGAYNGNVLFERVGSKIMGLAKVIFWIVVIINLLISFYMIYGAIKAESLAAVIPALIVAGAGVVAGWLSSVLLYGYGQLIETQQTAVDELSEIKQLLKQQQ